MSNVNAALALAQTPSYSMDQILQATQPQKQPSGFRKILGSVVGGVGNMFAPGLGGMIGSAISGNSGINQTGLMGDVMGYLQLQQQMAMEQQAVETASSVIKAKHDAAMSAIRNIA
jgi:hypothetical protein